MKKVVLALAVFCSVALVSCSSKEAAKADSETVAVESTQVVEDTVTPDSPVVADSVVADSAK